MPAYKGQQRIARAVNSIFAQDYTNWEIVIISDDRSDYEQVLADQGIRHDKIKFYSTGKRASGAGNARNVGLENAKGDVIALLDCDDAFHPARLSKMLPLVEKYGAAVTDLKLIDEKTLQEIPNISIKLNDEKLFPDQVFHRFFHAQSVAVFDRKLITHYYTPLLRYEDNVFLMQIYNSIDVIGFVCEPHYHYYKYPGASTSFSVKGSDVSSAFLKSAYEIKDAILKDQIYFKSEVLKKIVCESMDCAVAAQSFFIDQCKKSPNVQLIYSEVMSSFLREWPLPASLLAARQ